MRLWHQQLIPNLPRPQLLGQHRECCALRGGGWMKPHATVNYVFTHPFEHLVLYHNLVMDEMEHRGYRVDPRWRDPGYRGLRTPPVEHCAEPPAESESLETMGIREYPIYPEHDAAYLEACLDNLRAKGVVIERTAIEGV